MTCLCDHVSWHDGKVDGCIWSKTGLCLLCSCDVYLTMYNRECDGKVDGCIWSKTGQCGCSACNIRDDG